MADTRMLVSEIRKTIREVPDFPKPGINFYDVSTLFRDARALRASVDRLVERFEGERIDVLAGIEARGFVLASVWITSANLLLLLAVAWLLLVLLLLPPARASRRADGRARA